MKVYSPSEDPCKYNECTHSGDIFKLSKEWVDRNFRAAQSVAEVFDIFEVGRWRLHSCRKTETDNSTIDLPSMWEPCFEL